MLVVLGLWFVCVCLVVVIGNLDITRFDWWWLGWVGIVGMFCLFWCLFRLRLSWVWCFTVGCFLFGLCWVRLGFWVGFFVVFIMLCCCVVVLCFGFCFVILDLFCCWFSWLFCGVGWCFVVGLWVGCGGGGWLGFVCFF